MNAHRPAPSDAIDLADIARTIVARWRVVAACALAGAAIAVAVLLIFPPRFRSEASVLARAPMSGGGSILSRIGGAGDLLGGLAGGGSGGGIETEIQLLRSRTLAGEVVDSLALQLRVRTPRGMAPERLVSATSLPGSFAQRKLSFTRRADGAYDARWKDSTYVVRPGEASSIGVGSIVLRAQGLPESFALTVLDREDALDRFGSRLNVSKLGGELVAVTFNADDSVTAAAAVNGLASRYIALRRVTDRSANARRVDYVTAQMDSTGATLTATERELRRYQESSQVLDAQAVGRVDLERASLLRRALAEAEVNAGAMQQLVGQARAGRITSRELAAYPTFLVSASVAPLVSQLSLLEAERLRLLETRTPQDPSIQTLDRTMAAMEKNIAGLADAYASAVIQQRDALRAQVDSVQKVLLALPANEERAGRLKRDVVRLSEIYTALQAQLVEARLGVIGEGGEARQVDHAEPSKKPAFPQAGLTLGLGLGGGLATGLVLALLLGAFGRWLRDPSEVERALGVATQRFAPDQPIAMVEAGARRTLLVAPIGRGADTSPVTARLARTARQRALATSILDLSVRTGTGDAESSVAKRIEQLEGGDGMVIVQLPSIESDEAMAALRESRPVLLVAHGPVDRTELTRALAILRRLNVPCAGVLISENGRHALKG